MSTTVDMSIVSGWTGPVQTVREKRTSTEYVSESYEVPHTKESWHADERGDRTSAIHTETTYETEYRQVPREVTRDVDVGAIAIAFDDGTTGNALALIHEHAIPGDRVYHVQYACDGRRWSGCLNASTGRWMWHDRRVEGASDKAASLIAGAMRDALSGMSGRRAVMEPMAVGGLAVDEAVLLRREGGRVTLDVGDDRKIGTETNALFDAMPDGALVIIARPRISGGILPVISYALDPATLREHVRPDVMPDRDATLSQDRSVNGAAMGLAALTAGLLVMMTPGTMSYAGVAIAMCGMAASVKAVCERGDTFMRYEHMQGLHRDRMDAVRRTRLVARRWTWRRIRERI